MVTNSWIYDAIIYTYALSLLFYFSDVVGMNRKAKRMGTGFLVFVWLLQTAFMAVRMVRHQDIPVFSSFEFMLLFSWLLVTVSLIISRFFHIEFIVFFVNLIGFALLLVNMLNDPTTPTAMKEWEMMRNLLSFHIALAACGFAALTVGAVFAGMYLFLHRKLKAKQWSDAVRRLPSLEKMERLSYSAAVIGIPLFLMSLSVAIGAVLLGNRTELLFDLKIWLTLFALILYSFYFVTRSRESSTGFRLALWNLGCYAAMVLNFSLNSLSTFHRWMGV
ncbi:cytochrome C assembly family protein [Paenibacillus apiarius]|uniref:Cytochrome c biogenesis protein CcsA n=1 Tax=Paenibacillus apiarius TaxID=46240 RepID=A0ABT4E1X0_9BACL|nr:cytochrome c biogenesis protein CcsA [Paenibacillus apiarius]MCY9516522.1 cytochrome c biogenesis protein CcsA [Paenibacillus apiarius]MCY9522513.1 cytochrome c biogenesis protein CcsA [Paenibacillus apiarius]MCY9554563.1 cytochrome c biogenesis protein CcsA [Paenibacillus apiarius]MCY9556679.1 cytochrome c biogenesis protein CcsA [Paenibacillus apiarius]MCY9686640.1 cytochrome c biogenesis protein CcsA [Paenibacillus apiarius]